MPVGRSIQRKRNKLKREPRRKGEERRQQILVAARHLLMSGGPEAIGMRRLAARVGITHGNLQYYFPTRRELLVELFDQEVAKYTTGVRDAVAATKTRRGRLNALIDSGLALIRTPETVLWRQMVGMVDQDPDIAALHAREIVAYEDAIARELQTIEPKLTRRRGHYIAKIIQAIIDGLSLQYAHVDPEDPEIRAMETEVKTAILALLSS